MALMVTSNDDVYIAIMGVTEAGKSSFIARLTNQNIGIGHSLFACTQNVDDFTFALGDRNIHLIDTPGFDDTRRSDREVLEDIAKWLGESYKQDIKLHAVLYLHRITDNKLGGVALRNLVMFKKLCGADFYPRVCLITTRWDEVASKDGIRREEEMIKTDDFWGTMVERGAGVLRHDGSEKSAKQILNQVLQNRAKDKPKALRVQHELINEHLRLSETAAGQTFEAELIRQREEHQRQIKKLQQDMHDLMEMNEKKAAEDAARVKRDLESRIQQGYEDQRRLAADFEALQRDSAEKVRMMEEQFERQKREYDARVEHIEEMKKELVLYRPGDPEAVQLVQEIKREQQELPQLAQTIEAQKFNLQQALKRLFVKGKIFVKQNPELATTVARYGIGFASTVMRHRQMKKVRNQSARNSAGLTSEGIHDSNPSAQQPFVEEVHDEDDAQNGGGDGLGQGKSEAELDDAYHRSFYLTK